MASLQRYLCYIHAMSRTLVVLAAGIGSRYGGPKQIASVGPSGETLLDYAVYDAVKAGCEDVVFVVREEIERDFREVIGTRIERVVPTSYALQELSMVPEGCTVPTGRTKPWGTGHALLVAAKQVTKPMIVINADDFYGGESYSAISTFMDGPVDTETEYAIVGFKLANTLSPYGGVSRGICRMNSTGHIESIDELHGIQQGPDGIVSDDRKLMETDVASMNMWGLGCSVFGHLQASFEQFFAESGGDMTAEFMLPVEIATLTEAGKISVTTLATHSQWFGMTNRDDHAIVKGRIADLVADGTYPNDLWADRA